MRKIKIGKIQNKMLFIGVRLSILNSLLEILQDNIREIEDKSSINAQNLLIVIIKEFRGIKKRFNKIEEILNI